MKATGFDRGLRSPGLWLVLAIGVSVLTAAAAAAAFASPKPPWERDFVGLWEGVDALDGSTVQVSLSDIEGDGVLELRQREGFYTVCFKEGPGFSQGRGFITGSGIVTTKGVLDLETSLFCVDDDNVVKLLVKEDVQYTLRSEGQVLQLPQFDDNPRVVLHRTSS
jgi:hypothetical protein